jgi:hypothetical protein
MILLFTILLIACGIGAALQSRRGDPRFLVAIIAPWVIMPNILCQMMVRYEVWGALLSVVLVAVMPELLLLYFLLTLMSAGMIANQALTDDDARSPQMHQLFSALFPDDGWIMLVAAAVIIFIALVPARRITGSLLRRNAHPTPGPLSKL